MKRKDVKIGDVYWTKVGSGYGRQQVKTIGWSDHPIDKPDFIVKRIDGTGRELARSAAALHTKEVG